MIDQVFHFIAALGFHAPVTWVWNSICLDFRSSYNYVIFKDIYSQFDVLDAILSDIVLALYFDWIHWLHDSSLTYIYGSGNGSIYSIPRRGIAPTSFPWMTENNPGDNQMHRIQCPQALSSKTICFR